MNSNLIISKNGLYHKCHNIYWAVYNYKDDYLECNNHCGFYMPSILSLISNYYCRAKYYEKISIKLGYPSYFSFKELNKHDIELDISKLL